MAQSHIKVGGGGWSHHTAAQLTQTSTSCLTTLRFYKVKLTHLNLLYLFSCNKIFKHVPLKQKESELHHCEHPPMIWGTPVDQFDLQFRNISPKISWIKSCRVQESSHGGLLQTLSWVVVGASMSSLWRTHRALMRALISPILWRWTVYP